jgi:O-antigen ligase
LARWRARIAGAIGDVPATWIEVAVAAAFAVLVARATLAKTFLGPALVVALLAGVVLMRRPAILLYAIVVFIPIQWVTLLGDRLRVISFLTVAAFAYYLARALVRRRRMGDPVVAGYLAFLAACGLSLLASLDVGLSIAYLKFYVLALLFGFATLLAIEDARGLRILVAIVFGWGVALAVLALLQSLVSPAFFPAYHFRVFGMAIVDFYAVAGIRRASGTFENGPRLAMFLLLPTALAIVSVFGRDAKRRAPHVAALVLFGLALVVSFTRAALLLAAVMIPLLFAIEKRRGMIARSLGWLALALGIGGALGYLVLPDTVLAALAERFELTGSATYKDRFYFLWNALNAFVENPLIGLGIGTYGLHSWDLMQRYPVPWPSLRWESMPIAMPESAPVHNTYARILAETGLPGLAAYVAVFAMTIGNYRRALRRATSPALRRTALAFLLYFLVMLVYWFAHEYVIEEPYVALLPVLVAVLVRRLADAEADSAPEAREQVG